MHVNPAKRFDSVHALGQALWSFASSRGQVEWKNYYFHTPAAPAFDEGTLRGIPHAPVPGASGMSVPDGVPVARAGESTAILPVEPTAILAASVNIAPEISAAASPQLFLSTKLAKPTPPTGPAAPTPAEEPAGDHSWRRWATFGVAAGIILGGLWIGYRHFGTAAATASIAPVVNPAGSTVSKLELPTAPPAAVRAPDPVELPRSNHPEAPAQAPVATAPPKAQRKTRSLRQIHAPQNAQAEKLTGLDKNGIGIPSN